VAGTRSSEVAGAIAACAARPSVDERSQHLDHPVRTSHEACVGNDLPVASDGRDERLEVARECADVAEVDTKLRSGVGVAGFRGRRLASLRPLVDRHGAVERVVPRASLGADDRETSNLLMRDLRDPHVRCDSRCEAEMTAHKIERLVAGGSVSVPGDGHGLLPNERQNRGEGCEPELQQDVGGRCPPTVLRLGLDEGDVAEITGFGCREEAPQCRVSELMAARDERSPMPPGASPLFAR